MAPVPSTAVIAAALVGTLAALAGCAEGIACPASLRRRRRAPCPSARGHG
jgi:hypothetical protein